MVILVLGRRDRSQETLQLVPAIRSFVPDDHLLVRIDSVLDLSWLEEEVGHLYSSETGRPSVPPESVVRLMLAGFLERIVHDRALLRRAQHDIAFRWFMGYGLDESLPDHSSLTRIRARWGVEVFERVFERTVAQCQDAGLIDASTLHVDSTLVRADASPDSFAMEHLSRVREVNGDEEPEDPDPPPDNGGGSPGADGPGGGSPEESASDGRDSMGDVHLGPLSARQRKSQEGRGVRLSTTDPDCRFGRSSRRQPYVPSYKAHAVVEDQSGVIVGLGVTGGHIHDSETLLSLVQGVSRRLGQSVQRVSADTAYGTARNLAALEAWDVESIINPQRPSRHRGGFGAWRFSYDPRKGRVRCPGKQYLDYSGRTDEGMVFGARAKVCGQCRFASACLPKSGRRRTIVIRDGHLSLVRARRRQQRGEIRSHELSRRRWGRVERIFGEAKERHGMRRVARRGMAQAWIQIVLTAAVQNLRRLATHRAALASQSCSIWGLRNAQNASERLHIPTPPAIQSPWPLAA